MPAWFMLQDLRTHSMGFLKAGVTFGAHFRCDTDFVRSSSIFSTASLLEISDTAYYHQEDSQNIWLGNFTSHVAKGEPINSKTARRNPSKRCSSSQ